MVRIPSGSKSYTSGCWASSSSGDSCGHRKPGWTFTGHSTETFQGSPIAHSHCPAPYSNRETPPACPQPPSTTRPPTTRPPPTTYPPYIPPTGNPPPTTTVPSCDISATRLHETLTRFQESRTRLIVRDGVEVPPASRPAVTHLHEGLCSHTHPAIPPSSVPATTVPSCDSDATFTHGLERLTGSAWPGESRTHDGFCDHVHNRCTNAGLPGERGKHAGDVRVSVEQHVERKVHTVYCEHSHPDPDSETGSGNRPNTWYYT